jgi:hypothetical protein
LAVVVLVRLAMDTLELAQGGHKALILFLQQLHLLEVELAGHGITTLELQVVLVVAMRVKPKLGAV